MSLGATCVFELCLCVCFREGRCVCNCVYTVDQCLMSLEPNEDLGCVCARVGVFARQHPIIWTWQRACFCDERSP